jgi:hypothetical protein
MEKVNSDKVGFYRHRLLSINWSTICGTVREQLDKFGVEEEREMQVNIEIRVIYLCVMGDK